MSEKKDQGSQTPEANNAQKFDNTNLKPENKQGKGRSNRHRGSGHRGGRNPNFGSPSNTAGKRPASVHNDVNWYLSNPILASAVGTFSMNDPVGTAYHDDGAVKFSYNDRSAAVVNGTDVRTAVPGVAAFYFVPTIPLGPKVGANFLNQLAMKLYIYVRHQNSGHANYEYADMLQALYSVISINGIYGTLTRLYGTLLKYSVLNKYKAEAIVKAQGFDYTDLIQRLPDLYALIERLRCAFDAFPIPKNLPVADRQLWMTGNIFKDSEDIKTPLWMFVQSHYYGVPNIDGLQQAQPCPWYDENGSADDGTATFDDVQTLINTVIANLCSDEDYGIIFGDILKAYGAENCAVLKQISRDYEVTEVYDANANLQLHNATCINFDYSGGGINARILQEGDGHRLAFYCNITQPDDAGIKTNLTLGDTFLLSFPKHEVTPGEFLVATRLTARWEYLRPTGQTIWNLVQCGTEVLVGGYIWYFQSADSGSTISLARQEFTTAYVLQLNTNASAGDLFAFLQYTRFLYLYSQFDSLPRSYATAYRVLASGDLQLPTNLYGMFDLDCFVIIDKLNLDSLNYVAAMSEFGYTDATRVG